MKIIINPGTTQHVHKLYFRFNTIFFLVFYWIIVLSNGWMDGCILAAKANAFNERAQYLLKALIERYIEDGNPVGSRSLARDCGIDLSPATVRNVMSDLEDLGLVISPHTSAGRVPTEHGYRTFVDSLLDIEPPDSDIASSFKDRLNSDADNGPQYLLETTSHILSGLTRMASLVTLPKRENIAFRQVEFLPLSNNRVLAILVVNKYEVQNRILHVDKNYTAAQLEQAANYLNDVLPGKDIKTVRSGFLNEMKRARDHMNQIMQTAIDIASKILVQHEVEADDLVVSGQTNLMGFSDLSDIDHLRTLFDAFTQKKAILDLLDRCLQSDGIQIFIGTESGYTPLDGCSMITSRYSVDGELVGVLGVVGPTRMNYQRVISVVDMSAKLLGSALKAY